MVARNIFSSIEALRADMNGKFAELGSWLDSLNRGPDLTIAPGEGYSACGRTAPKKTPPRRPYKAFSARSWTPTTSSFAA